MAEAHSAEAASWLVRTPIAHRGSFDNPRIPENSMAAFHASIERGLPIELDVHLSADGLPIVYHDSDLSRLTVSREKLANLPARELTELRLCGTEERIPLLRDVLGMVSGRVPLLIELKTHAVRSGKLERAVLKALEGYSGEFALQSFNPLAVGWLRRHAPEICRGQLSAGPAGIPMAGVTKPNFVAYRVDDLPHPAVTHARERGLPALAWTVRTPEQKALALAYADNYIFEDEATSVTS